jgi:chaperonin GroES
MATDPATLSIHEADIAAPEDALLPADPYPSLSLLEQIATSEGNIADLFDAQQLTELGALVVSDYERDLSDRSAWEEVVTRALDEAAQGEQVLDMPLPDWRMSSKNFPILTVAALQFNARAYPAVCKSGNIVKAAVIGSDKGRPLIGPDGQQAVMVSGQPVAASQFQAITQQAQAEAQATGQEAPQPQAQPAWEIPPGAKAKRAQRIADYLNVYIEYRMDDWEEDTDTLLFQESIVGCGFRKLWWDGSKQCAAYVPALNLVVPKDTKSLKTTPRITEKMPDVYPYQIRQRMAAGQYRRADLPQIGDDPEAPRLLLEAHRLFDLDGDGIDEPYIVTVDKETAEVLKVVANFGPEQVRLAADGAVLEIERGQFYVKYGFIPDPKGGFYDVGFGYLLKKVMPILNGTLDAMFDATSAQVAGGGFIANGVRLQGNGQTNTLRWMPGEYKTVNASGATLREAIYERTFPGASPIMYQLFELILGAAKDITSIKDVVTGEASNNGQVGTTLALIEQGLQVFTAIYKRVYRSLGQEFQLIYENLGRYGGEEAAADYDRVLDDPEADFAKDFAEADMDIRPVADPTSVTKMQRAAQAQFLMQTGAGDPNVDQRELKRRVFQAADVPDIDALLPPPNPDAPPPPEALKIMSEVQLNNAETEYKRAQTAKLGFETGAKIGSGPEPMNDDQP